MTYETIKTPRQERLALEEWRMKNIGDLKILNYPLEKVDKDLKPKKEKKHKKIHPPVIYKPLTEFPSYFPDNFGYWKAAKIGEGRIKPVQRTIESYF